MDDLLTNLLPDSTDLDLETDISEEELFSPEYQANMFLIESALRETGAMAPAPNYNRSPYDRQLLKLIDSVPVK